MQAIKKENTIKVKFVNGSFDIRDLYARAHELAVEAGWKDYMYVGKGKGNEITILRTK